MQVKLPGGYAMICGGCSKDAEFKRVGQNQSRLCKVGVAVGKHPDPANPTGEPITTWANVVAWHDLASVLATAHKGDKVLVIGRVVSREYEGKTYVELEAEWIGVCAPVQPSAPDFSDDLGDDDDFSFP